MQFTLSTILAYAAFTAAGPSHSPRAVASLNEEATAEAHQRDNGATRAFSNVQIKTSDGRCLFVDKLSGDFRANLTPIQVASCGSTDGQGWDVITAGKHNDAANSALVVSTLTQACFNFDPRRAAGNQANLFSCGGRADGGGAVTTSQLFAFSGGAGPLSFEPANAKGSCLTVKGNTIDIASCNNADANQSFTLGGAPAGGAGNGAGNGQQSSTTAAAGNGGANTSAAVSSSSSGKTKTRTKAPPAASSTTATGRGGTGAATTSSAQQTEAASSSSSSSSSSGSASASASASSTSSSQGATTTAPPPAGGNGNGNGNNGGASAIPNPTAAVPVSRAGGTLNPTAAAESHQKDGTATRAFTSVEIRAPNGQCLFVDPTAGDFRQNLIPVSLVDCSGTPNERWDVITAGKHNNAKGSAIFVSSLMNGCISTDGRRAAGDTVTIFSCGGRADGGGETNSGQTVPFVGSTSFSFAPSSDNGRLCVLPGNGRLETGPCPTDGSQLFSIFP